MLMQTEARGSKMRATREAGARMRFRLRRVGKQEQTAARRKYEAS